MSIYLTQLKHNENFHNQLCTHLDNQYFDWKITTVFYCAYHLVQALAEKRNVRIGDRHSEILRNLNPKNSNRPIQFKSKAFDNFDTLFEYSQSARYHGFTDFDTFQQIKRKDYEHSLALYKYLREYIKCEGVEID